MEKKVKQNTSLEVAGIGLVTLGVGLVTNGKYIEGAVCIGLGIAVLATKYKLRPEF